MDSDLVLAKLASPVGIESEPNPFTGIAPREISLRVVAGIKKKAAATPARRRARCSERCRNCPVRNGGKCPKNGPFLPFDPVDALAEAAGIPDAEAERLLRSSRKPNSNRK